MASSIEDKGKGKEFSGGEIWKGGEGENLDGGGKGNEKTTTGRKRDNQGGALRKTLQSRCALGGQTGEVKKKTKSTLKKKKSDSRLKEGRRRELRKPLISAQSGGDRTIWAPR